MTIIDLNHSFSQVECYQQQIVSHLSIISHQNQGVGGGGGGGGGGEKMFHFQFQIQNGSQMKILKKERKWIEYWPILKQKIPRGISNN